MGRCVLACAVVLGCGPQAGTPEVVAAGESQRETGNEGFLVKYDADGVELWQQTWRPDDGLNVKICDLVTTADGKIVVAGTEHAAGEEPDAYWLRAFTSG